MAYFAVHAIDRPGMAGRRAELRPGHRERLRSHDHPVIVRIGGPLLGPEGGMEGSLLVVEAADRTAVETYLAGDPYVLADLYERVEIREFAWGLGQPEES